MHRTLRLIGLFGLLVLCGACAKKSPTLNLLVWEGYADPSFVKGFE
jgi:spermidine/putrescine-binding protein